MRKQARTYTESDNKYSVNLLGKQRESAQDSAEVWAASSIADLTNQVNAVLLLTGQLHGFAQGGAGRSVLPAGAVHALDQSHQLNDRHRASGLNHNRNGVSHG